MPVQQPVVVVLEIGTSNVRVLVGEIHQDGLVMIVSAGECPSRGVRKSEITDFDNALACVKQAVSTAEAQSECDINQVHLIVSGSHIQSLENRGSTPVLNEFGQVTEEEIEQAMKIAKAVNLPPEREILHSVRQICYVDDQEGVLNPEGLTGSKLAIDMLLLHAVRNRIRNSVKVVKAADMDVQDVAFGGLCAGLAVLTPAQKEAGVLQIDLGGGTTDYVAYAGQALADAGSLAVGGDHVTNDIAVGLSLPITQAEKLKKDAGHAMPDPKARDQAVSVHAEGGFPGKTVKVNALNTIIQARMQELFMMVRRRMDELGIRSMLGAGVVLTGGGAKLKQVETLAEQIFELPCHMGKPRSVAGVSLVTDGCEYAAPIGMIRYGVRSMQGGMRSGVMAQLFGKMLGRG